MKRKGEGKKRKKSASDGLCFLGQRCDLVGEPSANLSLHYTKQITVGGVFLSSFSEANHSE